MNTEIKLSTDWSHHNFTYLFQLLVEITIALMKKKLFWKDRKNRNLQRQALLSKSTVTYIFYRFFIKWMYFALKNKTLNHISERWMPKALFILTMECVASFVYKTTFFSKFYSSLFLFWSKLRFKRY